MKTIGLIAIAVAIGFLTNAIFPSIQAETLKLIHKFVPYPTPTSIYQEITTNLNPQEKATMSGNFMAEYLDATDISTFPGTIAGASTVSGIIRTPTLNTIQSSQSGNKRAQ